MTYSELIKRIKKDSWWTEESPCNYQLSFSAWHSFILQGQIWGPKYLTMVMAIFRNDYLYEKTPLQEKLSQFNKARTIFQKNPEKIIRLHKKFISVRQKMLGLGETVIKKLPRLSAMELAVEYDKIYQAYTNFFIYSVITEAADVYSDLFMLRDLQEEVGEKINLTEACIALASYPVLSFMEQERLAFLKESLKAKPNFLMLSQDFHWIQNNYLSSKHLSEVYFKKSYLQLIKTKNRNAITEELKILKNKVKKIRKNKRIWLKKLKLSAKLRSTFELLSLLSKWQDERKFGVMHAIYYVDAFLYEIAKRTQISKELLGYYTPQELTRLLTKQTAVPLKVLRDRKKFSVYVCEKQGRGYKGQILTGKKARLVYRLLEPKRKETIQGFTASAPIESFRGVVQIVNNPHKEKFRQNRILVTTMTRPDFVPLMRKASAIVTDEGGITSHAAILSRELGIPCIIGTKIATKILKNGNKIELDMNKGIIKKIKD